MTYPLHPTFMPRETSRENTASQPSTILQPSSQRFSELPYKRPDLEELKQRYQRIKASLSAATTLEECQKTIMEWNRLRIEYSTMDSIAGTRFKQNVKDEVAVAEHQFFIENGPTVTEWDEECTKVVLQHPLRKEISEAFGALFIRRMEDASRTFTPAIKELLVEEANLGQAYTALLAEGEIEFRGERYNLSGIRKFAEDVDRTTRREALEAQQQYLMSIADKLDSMYDSLVKLRHQIAQRTGFSNFVEYRYVQMGRIDYTPADVARFRGIIRNYAVPVAERLYKAQAERLGLSYQTRANTQSDTDTTSISEQQFSYYDEALHFPDGNPHPTANEPTIVQAAQQMYRELSPETGAFFDMMVAQELMDLSTRPNKARGGYCTSFPMYGTPFIFSNFNGTAADITVLTHEAGHAFQVYSSSRNHALLDYLWPTMEACEIHSFGMELFTWQWMEQFFGEKAARFRFTHLEQALTFLPYSCAVDEFQEWVYSAPEASAEERCQRWKEIERTYLPWRCYNGLPFNESGRFWQTQLHIYLYPFYYIDYALAQVCALQFWQRIYDASPSSAAFREAFNDYVRICTIGGSQSFLDIVRAAQLHSPFEATTIQSVIQDAMTWLEQQMAN